MKEDLNKVTSDTKLLISADKTSNTYQMSMEDYNLLIKKEVEKNYRVAKKHEVFGFKEEQKEIVNRLDIGDKVFATAERPAFGTFKDT